MYTILRRRSRRAERGEADLRAEEVLFVKETDNGMGETGMHLYKARQHIALYLKHVLVEGDGTICVDDIFPPAREEVGLSVEDVLVWQHAQCNAAAAADLTESTECCWRVCPSRREGWGGYGTSYRQRGSSRHCSAGD